MIASCGNTPQRGEPILDENYQPTPVQGTTSSTTTPPPKTPEPAQNAAGVWHYTCPNGCAGGAGSASPCAGCGTTLVHNQEYHNTPATTPAVTSTPSGIDLGTGTSITPLNANGTVTPPTPPRTPEPAQNAKGIWHYICSAGCTGGAGSAVACAGCGKTLVHNQAYHDK